MKKVLFLSLILAIGMTGFAQKDVAVKAGMNKKMKMEKKALGKEVATEAIQFTPNGGVPAIAHYGNRYDARVDYETMYTQMDLQSNAFVANRMWRFDDGTVGITAIFPDNGTNRGTGYNYFDGEDFGSMPEARLENIRTGWPSYCQYGPNGEIIVAHTGSDLVYYTRENKGEGEWQGPTHIPNPNLGFPNEELTWPRVVTSGPNHDIIHVICATQDDESISWDFYAKSTDGESWEVTTVPTWTDEHFSADSYALAANGNNVAMLYCGSFSDDAFIVKSTDNGGTWTRTTIWDNPYSEMDWDNDPACIFDDTHEMYCPENGAICIDDNGMVHCAFSVAMITHTYGDDGELGTFVYSGLTASDGIFYWNESMGTLQPTEWVCPEDGWVMPADPHDVFRFWYPTAEPNPDGDNYVRRNFDKNIIGFVDPSAAQDWDNNMFHHSDYYAHWLGCSATPAICVDDRGIIAIAYSVADPARIESMAVTDKYPRSVVISYIEPPYQMGDALYDYDNPDYNYTTNPGNYFYNIEYLQDIDDVDWGFTHSADEAIWVNSITNTVNGEFWFSFHSDELVGLNQGSVSSQTAPTDGTIWAVKIVPDSELCLGTEEKEVINPMTSTRVFPNPVTSVLNIEVNASQSSEMTIAVYNITGQKVMEKDVNISAGINTPSINTSNLTSGIYFVTVKANGFENTMKFIVK